MFLADDSITAPVDYPLPAEQRPRAASSDNQASVADVFSRAEAARLAGIWMSDDET